MELTRLIDALSHPAAFPHPVDTVEVHQTHISAVLLAGAFAYKVKKPVNLPFVDYSTLERRRHFCEEEVRLNRRLAPEVYLGVVPVTLDGASVKLEGAGPVIDWAVKMERLPAGATLEAALRRRALSPETVETLAARIAGFHSSAESGAHIAEFGRFAVVSRNALENFEQAKPKVGSAVSRRVFDRLKALTVQALDSRRDLIEHRAERSVPRDTHGDLRLEHVYVLADRRPPSDLVIVDCIEFNERFRFADPVSDMAFLAMDLAANGRRDLADRFTAAYFRASNDEEGRTLLPFYTAYRAAVRGKVEGIKASEREVPDAERTAALAKARGHWLVALGALEEPSRAPCLLLVGGLPGAGKSTLARALADKAGFTVIRSDVVRKELTRAAGVDATRAGFEDGLYAPEWTERSYTECIRRAEEIVYEGGRALIDASFREDARRAQFLDAADRWGVPSLLLVCRADPETRRDRLARRTGDASDADWSVSERLAELWEEPGPRTSLCIRSIDTGADRADAIAQALTTLRAAELLG
jgi:aminoglycoside phosphotransferase family enzyme/predicted kinase